MRVTSSKHFYYSIRACLALLGLFLVTASVFSIVYPDIVHSELSPSTIRNFLIDVSLLVYGGLLLTPFRWLKRSFVFPFALLIFALAGLWAAYTSLEGMVGLLHGKRSWLILPVSAIFILLTLSAPGALIMRSRLDAVR
jgi:hypothetical protein